uniref:Clip domain-containing protein n=1 Tax=Steinernema glaseri TaxID=37863 RepID=A0A1I8AQY8_9BILA
WVETGATAGIKPKFDQGQPTNWSQIKLCRPVISSESVKPKVCCHPGSAYDTPRMVCHAVEVRGCPSSIEACHPMYSPLFNPKQMDIPMRHLINVKLVPVTKTNRAICKEYMCRISNPKAPTPPHDAEDCDMCLVDFLFVVLYACTGVLYGV